MAEHTTSHLWIMRAAYLFLGVAVIFFDLIPYQTTPRQWVGPDVLVALTFAWALRRPEYVPALSIAAVMLLADLMLQRPPGLFAALVLIASESLKGRSRGLRDQLFPVEWLTVSSMLAATMVAERLILTVLMVDRTPLGLTLMQFVVTLLAYPFVVIASRYALGIRKSSLGEINALGQRL